MNLHKNWRVIILLVAMAVQGVVISQLTRGGGDNVIWQIAGEIPESGSILLLALGSLWLRNKNRKNRR
ncbi:MAG: PEP-CTERM sorting domain-containing protein [Planctomycetota bacterium]